MTWIMPSGLPFEPERNRPPTSNMSPSWSISNASETLGNCAAAIKPTAFPALLLEGFQLIVILLHEIDISPILDRSSRLERLVEFGQSVGLLLWRHGFVGGEFRNLF